MRTALLLAVASALGAAWYAGAFEHLSAENLRAGLAAAGPLAPLVYVAAFALLEPFGAPGIAFVIPASLIWSPGLAFLLSWLGAIGAGALGFGFARWIGRDWVERRLPDRLRRYDARLAENGLATVIAVRLLFFLAPPAHWALGASRVPFPTFLLGSAIGFIPGIALLTLAGPRALAIAGSLEHPGLWLAGAVALAAAARFAWRRAKRR